MGLPPPATPVLSLVSLPKHSITESPAVLSRMTGDIRMKPAYNLSRTSRKPVKQKIAISYLSIHVHRETIRLIRTVRTVQATFQNLHISGKIQHFS